MSVPDFADLVERYIEVWNLPDDQRRAAVDDLFTADVLYCDPNVRISGREALDAYVGLTRRRYPGMLFTVSSDVDGHHQQARFAWSCGPTGRAPAVTGYDVALFEGGQVSALYGFFDRPTSNAVSR
jgi:hypothetical protein